MVVVLLIFIITVLISSCCYTGSNIDSVGYINKNLGFEIQNAYVICDYDTHGGFHGDGDRYIKIKVEDGDLEEKIEKMDDWFSEPTRDIKSCVDYIEYYILKGEQELPDFKNAYYYYDSLHVGKEFMAIYDRDTGELYYYEGTS